MAKAEEELLRAEQQLATAKATKEANQDKANEEKLTKTIADAEKKLDAAKKQVETATAAMSKPATTYTALGPIHPTTSTGRRTAFARWLTDRKNPLAARVAVNHIWLRHFGQALVPSVFDFGQNGQPPSHPALLDWLASELMEPSVQSAQPWSMKHLHRLIVTSNTYRQGSEERNSDASTIASPSNPQSAIPNPQSIDPENIYLWRMNTRRAEAEVVRDNVLYVAGQLDAKTGGPEIDCNQGLTSKRRSVYFRHAQEKQMEFLKLFDAAAVSECYERKESIVPQQALALANSELTLVQSRILARSLSDEFSTEDEPFIAAAFEQLLSRQPNSDEMTSCRQFLAEQSKWYAENQARVTATGGTAVDGSKPSTIPTQRARENLVHVLMNHHEFVTIR